MSNLYNVYCELEKIKNNEVSFQNLINKGFKDLSEKDSFFIRDSLKSIVNRYHFLAWEVKCLSEIQEEDIKDYLICALGQLHYVKDVTCESLLNAFQEDEEKFDHRYQPSTLYEVIKSVENGPLTISNKDNELINRRLSINYAYPEWIVKMMNKHFGIKHIYKSIASSRKNAKISININTFLTKKDELLKETDKFESGVLSSNSLRYIGKDKLIDLPEFKKNLIFVEDESMQLVVEKLNLEPGDNALLIASDKGSIALDMLMKMKDVGKLSIACKNIFEYNSIRNVTKRFKLNSSDVFESDLELLLSHVGEKSMDKVLLISPSSSLGLVRRNPAVLLTLKRDDLDKLIERQKFELNEAATFVKEGGTIIYCVHTFNKKESYNIVDEFLTNNPDFSLLEDRVIFAYEGPSDGLYYAILKRN